MIRPEQPADAEAIRNLLCSSFPTHGESQLVESLRAADRLVVSLVAERQGQIVGHVGFSPITLDPPIAGINGVGLAPLTVRSAWRRQGVGRELVEAGLAACRRGKFALVVVLGEPDYYGRFGFRPARRFGLDNEYDAADAFMAIVAQPDALKDYQGTVRYCGQFAELGE